LRCRRIFHHPTPWTSGEKKTGTRWEERLRGAAAQPPPLATVLETAQQTTVTSEPRAPIEERRLEPPATTGAAEPVVAHVEGEAPAEAGLVDIASIVGAPTVIVVRSSL
jgi:hypothetical protein